MDHFVAFGINFTSASIESTTALTRKSGQKSFGYFFLILIGREHFTLLLGMNKKVLDYNFEDASLEGHFGASKDSRKSFKTLTLIPHFIDILNMLRKIDKLTSAPINSSKKQKRQSISS